MRLSPRLCIALAVLLLLAFALARDAKETRFRLDSAKDLTVVGGKAEPVTYKGRSAVHLVPAPTTDNGDEDMIAILAGPDFKDGTIEVDVAGAPLGGAPADSRGFIGIAFRVQEKGQKGEYFYIRPTNARCDDQLRRNHTTQYVSAPDYPWQRLRKENPGVYESYADMDTGAWTRMKIVVTGTKALLYVNGASQPALVVNDLKLGESHGQIGLWAHSTTDAYFSNLAVR
ncbi:MAG TPA: family 16 glycoside hydrolase [Terriglobales bacterium]|nr:family 16 glycoside hydrolase [Terriglobales bacterium]